MNPTVKVWLKSLAAAFIAGGSAAASTSGVLLMARGAGMQVQAPDFKTAAIIFFAAGAQAVFLYLKQSPLPGVEDGKPKG